MTTMIAGNKALTPADKDALKRMPDGIWFGWVGLDFMIRNPRYRCDRLANAHVLERRVVGDFPDLRTEYRKTTAGAGFPSAKIAVGTPMPMATSTVAVEGTGTA